MKDVGENSENSTLTEPSDAELMEATESVERRLSGMEPAGESQSTSNTDELSDAELLEVVERVENREELNAMERDAAALRERNKILALPSVPLRKILNSLPVRDILHCTSTTKGLRDRIWGHLAPHVLNEISETDYNEKLTYFVRKGYGLHHGDPEDSYKTSLGATFFQYLRNTRNVLQRLYLPTGFLEHAQLLGQISRFPVLPELSFIQMPVEDATLSLVCQKILPRTPNVTAAHLTYQQRDKNLDTSDRVVKTLIQSIGSRWPRLQKLALLEFEERLDEEEAEKALLNTLQRLQRLEAIEIQETLLSSEFAHRMLSMQHLQSGLQELRLCCTVIHENALAPLASFTNLTFLELTQTSHLEDAMVPLFSHLTRIEHLHIDQNFNSKTALPIILSDRRRALRRVCLKFGINSRSKSDDSVKALIANHPTLEVLTIKDTDTDPTSRLTDAAFNDLHNLASLRVLIVQSSGGLVGSFVHSLSPERHPWLRLLAFGYIFRNGSARHISEEVLWQAQDRFAGTQTKVEGLQELQRWFFRPDNMKRSAILSKNMSSGVREEMCCISCFWGLPHCAW